MFKKILLASLLAFSAVACGGNECDDAIDKLEECGWKGEGGVEEGGECSGAAECTAKCFNDATCDEINKGSEKLSNCFSECLGT